MSMWYFLASFSLTSFELIMLIGTAIIFGVAIHFFITARQSIKNSPMEIQKVNKTLEQWKLKYFNDIDAKDKEMLTTKGQLNEAEEKKSEFEIEIEQLSTRLKRQEEEMKRLGSVSAEEGPSYKPDYISQLRQAQDGLKLHNDKINKLIGQIDVIKTTEEKQQEILQDNEKLSDQIKELKYLLIEKESELNQIKQKSNLGKEMASMLDSTYAEFDVLQGKIHKLEAQLSASKMTSIEYEDLKEAHNKTLRDLEEAKKKFNIVTNENQQLKIQLSEVLDKFQESNTQRQQLQKKMVYLEELNTDLQTMSEANKKLESQIKRIGELESMLNISSGEAAHLKRKESENDE